MGTIKGKITTTYTILFIVIFTVLAIFLSVLFGNQYIRTLEEDLVNNTNLLSGFIRSLDENFLISYAEDISSSLDLRVTILDIDGEPLVETLKPLQQLDNHIDRPEIQQALLGNTTTFKRYSDTIMGDMLYAASAIYNVDGEMIGFFRLSKSLVEIQKFINNIRLIIFSASAIGILATWVFGGIIAEGLTSNIHKLISKARDFGKGKFNPSKKIYAKDEIGELEEVFNEMGINVTRMMEKVSSERMRLENILEYLPVGVLLINTRGIVKASNSAAREILGSDLMEVNRPLIHLTRDYQVNDFVNNLLQGEQQQLEVILSNSNGERSFIRLNGAPLNKKQNNNPEEIVVVLQDITDLKKLEQMRKDLVANVSHELRTPVTAIQGFAETLLDEEVEEETSRHFLSIIKEESNRLSRLITDLLNLSKLESDDRDMKQGSSSLVETAKSVGILLEEKIKAKNQKLIIDLPKEIKLAVAQDYVEQVLVNYITNAIKYTPDGTKITLTADTQDNGFARIVVIDNGPGIPDKDQARLYERFFRVEKSRQRGVGGTGLGLAIVKHIVEGFNGEVGVRSNKDGTAFWATLPID